jgi:6-phosphogluconolactonase
MAIKLLVGTYARLGGSGLVSLTIDVDEMSASTANPTISDASFVVRSDHHQALYIAAERQDGRIGVADATAPYCVRSDDVQSGGAAPCHLALDPAGRRLAVANYESGSVALFALGGHGKLPPTPTALYQLSGSGPNHDRQASAHAHWVGFDAQGDRLYCVNLGGDQVDLFDLGPNGLTLDAPTIAYRTPAGSAPRHLAFHPGGRFAYLVSELASTVTVLAIAASGALNAVETLTTLPPSAGESLGGAIAINGSGSRLYVTNRGHDSIAVFAIAGSTLTLLDHVASGGASPRHLLLLENDRLLLVANEEGATVCQFSIDDDGRLTRRGEAATIPGAVFLLRAR